MAKKPHNKAEQMQIYHGTAPEDTHHIIKDTSFLDDGICLNIFHGFAKIKKTFAHAESIGLEIFMDNGSFERYTYAYSKSEKIPASKRIPLDVYYNEKVADEYFEFINAEYQKLFDASTNPERLIITVPEVIASDDMTQKLQTKYLPLYKKLQKKYGFKMIVSLQFNPHVEEWAVGLGSSAKFIAKHVDVGKNIRVGVPFGNDFKIIQDLEQFKKVDAIFDPGGTLAGYGAHLFAAGSPAKVVKYVEGWVDSVDSSTINNWARNAHYVTPEGKYVDIRDLQGKPKTKGGKPPSVETVKKAWAALKDNGIDPTVWMARKTPAMNWRYKVLLQNVDQMIAKAKGIPAPPRRKIPPPREAVPITDFPAAAFMLLPAVKNRSKKGIAGKEGITTRRQLVKFLKARGLSEKRASSQIERGIKVELEHTGTDKKASFQLAADHLVALPTYYTMLSKAEGIPKKAQPKKNRSQYTGGGNLYYFQPIPEGILLNMEDVRATLKKHGLRCTNVEYKPSRWARIHQVILDIDPASVKKVQKVEDEIDKYLRKSPITQGGKRSIIVQTTPKAKLLFVIEEGIARVFEGEPDDIDGY